MTDEAFALSPIEARASHPTDADYDAIHEAFMETGRGRWFLGEFAKRNRYADTRMVLDAVGRLEARLTTEPTSAAELQAMPQSDLWPELATAFTKTRIEIAQLLLRETNDQAVEAIRASVETIRSTSWALRERGFDAHICDLLDVQVTAITDGYTGLLAENILASEVERDVLAAFDALIGHVEGLAHGVQAEEGAMAALDEMVDAVADAMGEEEYPAEEDAGEEIEVDILVSSLDDIAPAVARPRVEPVPAVASESVSAETTPGLDAAFHAIYGDDGDIEVVEIGPVDETIIPAPSELELNRQRLYETKVAPYRSSRPAEEGVAKSLAAHDDIEIVDTAHRSVAGPYAADEPAPRPAPPVPGPPQAQPAQRPASLGQALLANGVIKPAAASRDPLAPFRRMSQAEKVALFT